MGVARRAGRRMARDVRENTFEIVDESKGGFLPGLAQVMIDGLVDVPPGQSPRNDRLGTHACPDVRTLSHNSPKYFSSAGAVEPEAAPSRSSPRRR